MNNEEIKVQSDQGYYLGVKLIKARKAWRINDSAIVYDMNRMVQHDDVVDEGYEVEYPDGYKSFSPKDVFEKAYYMILSPNKIQEGDVLNFIKEGYSLRLGEKDNSCLRYYSNWIRYCRYSCLCKPFNL